MTKKVRYLANQIFYIEKQAQRLLEWSGIAISSNNNGWFGKSDGSNAI